MKGHVRRLPFEQRVDTDTGAVVTRLTPPNLTSHRNYFYQKCFTNDGRRLIFGGGLAPEAPWHYHLLDLDEQTATQLSAGERENTFGGFLSPDDQALYFVRADKQLIRLDLSTLDEQLIYTVPSGWVGYGTWVANSACTKMVGIEIDARDWFELDDWGQFARMFYAKPRCRLISIHLASGQANTIFEREGWLGHPQYRPGDDNTVAYCHEGPHDLIDARIWFVNEDGSGRRCGKVHEVNESCTHEFWVPDGSVMIYVSFERGQSGRRVCSLNPDTLQSQVLTTMPPCSHLMSNHDGSWLVGDGSQAAHGPADPYLHWFDLKTGAQRRIARHDTSWRVHQGNRQATHPHPSFTPAQDAVLYTSDVEGAPALYLASLASA